MYFIFNIFCTYVHIELFLYFSVFPKPRTTNNTAFDFLLDVEKARHVSPQRRTPRSQKAIEGLITKLTF